mmetsp:Transcript_133205/g.385440  ORF Transcript_133205/g.385440 Transcript_133205/m.385440 type:complete len:219 (+) Transcript_133205:757-1413(+)
MLPPAACRGPTTGGLSPAPSCESASYSSPRSTRFLRALSARPSSCARPHGSRRAGSTRNTTPSPSIPRCVISVSAERCCRGVCRSPPGSAALARRGGPTRCPLSASPASAPSPSHTPPAQRWECPMAAPSATKRPRRNSSAATGPPGGAHRRCRASPPSSTPGNRRRRGRPACGHAPRPECCYMRGAGRSPGTTCTHRRWSFPWGHGSEGAWSPRSTL